MPVLTPRTAVSGILHGDRDQRQTTKSSMATKPPSKASSLRNVASLSRNVDTSQLAYLKPAEARSLTCGSSTKCYCARSSKKKPGDRWLSIADRHPYLLTHRCGPIQRGADRLKIQNPPTRRMYLRVSADPSETTASRHFNLSLHVLLSVSRREFLQLLHDPVTCCCKACMSGWVSLSE